jgi:hypothetical protein
VKRQALCAAIVLVLVVASARRADAMPPFAQAYGINCDVCHTMVPTLNSYGRYVQRTGYGSLDPHTLRRAFPIWIGAQVNYDSTSGLPDNPPKPNAANVAIHAVGAVANDFTYHAQQWIWQQSQAGDLDTLWLAYNNLLHRDGHLFVGKIEAPGPSQFSMWADIAPFDPPELVVGEHSYLTDANRWGTKLNYVKPKYSLEAGWLYSDAGWSGSSDFSTSDKTFQYDAALTDATKPWAVGYLGSVGTVPVSTGVDHYWTWGGWAQMDPTGNLPGVDLLYQGTSDNNPGADPVTGFQLPAASGHGFSAELYATFFHKVVYLSGRKQWTSDGLGNATQNGIVDLSFVFAKYLRGYTEVYMSQNNTPAWRYFLWWTTPVVSTPIRP